MRIAAGWVLAVLFAIGAGADASRQESPLTYWDEVAVPPRPPDDPALVARGKAVYAARCTLCHGREGDGEGIAAPYLLTKPRDFVPGHFKLRTTPSNRLPAEEDLYRSITRGIPQYGMPSYAYLSVEDRWALVKYLKTFSRIWKSWSPGEPVEIGKAPRPDPALLATGKWLYEGKRFDCASCHGTGGMGDGPEAAKQKDAWGNAAPPRAFSLGASYFKRGNRRADIVRTLLLGMPGSPMMPFTDKMKDRNELWALASYVRSLSEKKE